MSVPDDVYREARIRSLSVQEAEFARLEAEQKRVQSEIKHFRAADGLNRDELHERAPR